MKEIIGMIHLKALPSAPNNTLSIDEIFEFAKADLDALTEGGISSAIVENMFDVPYDTKPNLEILVGMTILYTRLKAVSKIPLGLNIQACNSSEEMVVATLCNAPYIRVETLVEERTTSFGRLYPSGPFITRKMQELGSNVQIYADINSKHTYPVSHQTLKETISAAIESRASKLILTGSLTGKSPSLEEARDFKKLCGDVPMLIGSGVSVDNIRQFLEIADGIIVGSSIKMDGKVDNPVDVLRVKEFLKALS